MSALSRTFTGEESSTRSLGRLDSPMDRLSLVKRELTKITIYYSNSGQRIFMYGAPTGDRFNVDLIARNGDILFHFNPRMPEGKVDRVVY